MHAYKTSLSNGQSTPAITLKLVLVSLFLILFIDGLGISIVLPLFADLFLSPSTSILPVSSTEPIRNMMYGIGLLSFSFGMFFGAPILGELSDKFGRKKILLLSLWGTLLGYVLSGLGVYFRFPELFIFGRVLDGLTAGSIPIAQAAISDISTEQNKASNLGLILFAVTAGYVLGPLFSEFLCKYLDQSLSAPFYGTALLSLISILLLLPMKESILRMENKKIQWLSFLNALTLIFKIRAAVPFIVIFLLFQLAWTMYFQYLPSFLSVLSLNSIIAKTLALLGLGMAISFCLLTRVFQNKVTPVQGSFLSISILMVAIFIQLPYIETTSIFFLFVFISAMAYGLGYSFLLVQMSKKVSNEFQGLVMGVAASMSALSAIITSFLGTILISINYQFIFLFSFLCLFMCSVLLYQHVSFKTSTD